MTSTAAPRGETGGFGQLDIGVVGAGRVGPVLANALRAAGHRVTGLATRSAASKERGELLLPGVPQRPATQVLDHADLVLLTVGDAELGPLVEELAAAGAWRPGQLVVHTAGRFGVAVLEPAARAGALTMAIHPAMTFSGTSLDLARLRGASFAITASGHLVPLAEAIVAQFEGRAVRIGEAERPLYHAALSHAANHLVTLLDQARWLLARTGVPQPAALLEPLVMAAAERALASGGEALTGPAARGDVDAIGAHLGALAVLAQAEHATGAGPAERSEAGSAPAAAAEPATGAERGAAATPAAPGDLAADGGRADGGLADGEPVGVAGPAADGEVAADGEPTRDDAGARLDEVRSAYRELARDTAKLAERLGRIDAEAAYAIVEAIAQDAAAQAAAAEPGGQNVGREASREAGQNVGQEAT